MTPTKRKISIAVVLAMLLTPGFTGTAVAGHGDTTGGGNVSPSCGDTLGGTAGTTYTLVADVGPCLPDASHPYGLRIRSGITLNLNGHKILGDTIAAGGDEAGILFDGVNGAKVTDSTSGDTNAVGGFDAGIAMVNGATNNTVEKVNILGNVGVDGDYGEGVHVRNSGGNTFKSNTISGNGPYAGITLLDDSDGNTIGGSAADGNVIAPSSVANQDIGIRLESGTTGTPAEPDSCTDDNTVSWNTISGSSVDGISILNGNKCDSSGNVLSHNAIFDNLRDGIRLNARCFSDANGTAAAPCPTATAPTLTVPHGALNNTVDHNAVCNNGGAGIRATFATSGNTISNNQAGDGATMHHGPAIPCLPNNPVTVPSPVGSPLLPPHGDLNDGNGSCAYNSWSNNTYTTKTPSCIS